MSAPQPIRGTHDIIGEEARLHRHVVATAYEAAVSYGYDEVQTPIFERSQVFNSTLGETSDIVSKETYTFIDRDGTSITLRPEFTAAIMRCVISNGLAQSLPLKFFSVGPLFRHERPQKCRYRQFNQVNFEYLGARTARSDVETIALAAMILGNLGLFEHVKLEINSLGDPESRQAYRAALVTYLQKNKSFLSKESLERLEKNPLRVLDSKDERDKEIIMSAPSLLDHLNVSSREHYEAVLEGLENLGISYERNPRIVRGLDYYTHTVFEFTTKDLGSQGTVLAGGRYDGLARMMGGPDIPAIGFAAGVERISALMVAKGIAIPPLKTFYVVAIGVNAEQSAQGLVHELRSNGLRVMFEYSGTVSKHFKRANTAGAIATIILGDEECNSGTVKVKDMTSGDERVLPRTTLKEYLKLL